MSNRIMAFLVTVFALLKEHAELGLTALNHYTAKFDEKLFGEKRASLLTAKPAEKAQRGQLGIFMVLVFGAVALVVVSIVLLFGQQIAGEFAAGIEVDNEYSDAANSTVNSTGNAFTLFGTSVLVIPAAAVLAVLIGGLIGAVTMVGGGALPGMGGQMRRGGR